MKTSVSVLPECFDAFKTSYQAAKSEILRLAGESSLYEKNDDIKTSYSLLNLEESQQAVADFCRQKKIQLSPEELTTEVIWLGSQEASNVLVLISGTHGVEGGVGAAVQLDFLFGLNKTITLPENTAVLIIFALNPFGFYFQRRCDERGIDLNRNFIDFGHPLPKNEGYEQLTPILFGLEGEEQKKALQAIQTKLGETNYSIAISGGQYCDPNGPFYGGESKSHGRHVIEMVIERFDLASRHLAVIDIHSGLGPFGHGELICDHPIKSSGYTTALQWFGASVTAPEAGNSSSVPKIGLLDFAWHKLMEKRGCFVTLEFGSFGTEQLFDVILNDHIAWKGGDEAKMQLSAQAMRHHFFPNDNNWQELVLVKSRQVIRQALNGLIHE